MLGKLFREHSLIWNCQRNKQSPRKEQGLRHGHRFLQVKIMIQKTIGSGNVVDLSAHQQDSSTDNQQAGRLTIKRFITDELDAAMNELATQCAQGKLTRLDVDHSIEAYAKENKLKRDTSEEVKREVFTRIKGLTPKQPEITLSKESIVRRQLTPAEQAIAEKIGKVPIYKVFGRTLSKRCYISKPEFADSIFNILISQLLPYGTTYVVHGGSSSGKSFVLKQAFSLLPKGSDLGLAESPGLLIDVTSLSKLAINYLGVISNHILYLGEIAPAVEGQSDDDTQKWLRQLHSEGKVVRGVPERKNGEGPFEVHYYTTIGPVVQVATTTKDPQAFCDENDNRTLWIMTDDSQQATMGVLSLQAEKEEVPW